MSDLYDRDRIYSEAALRRDLYELGAVDLDPPRRGQGFGFERKTPSADRRPRTASAWGVAPPERD